ncbi:IMPACT family protein [Dethiobacter alkaliphilus]|uniref:IMPACT family protein n=1 Tax=Dethiobacter alkaliphilus TaxID=427926 RepID=UPI0022267B3F|nr:YigZ family protein [Dethiobacter alkaliphilus]MCW3490759.1 IMPACT family protein [Dethiobacter alkaliphilus]
MIDSFSTVARNVRVKIAVGACRFIASVAKTETEAEAKAFIEKVSGEFADATHNVYAYRIGVGDGAVSRQSDDGEPAGSSGPPMLQALEKAGLTNVTVVGTRYFGGVKLGIGGLVRAYRACAEAGLAEAGEDTEVFKEVIKILVSYDLLGNVMREIGAVDGEVDGVDYQENGVCVTCLLPLTKVETLKTQLVESTRGNVTVEIGHNNR